VWCKEQQNKTSVRKQCRGKAWRGTRDVREKTRRKQGGLQQKQEGETKKGEKINEPREVMGRAERHRPELQQESEV